MSRRLENIQTGFVDYGAAGKGLLEGFQYGRNIALQEEERRRKQQELENQRATIANNIYNKFQSDLEQYGKQLTTEEKVAFNNQFDEIMKMNRDLRKFAQEGGKINSPEFTVMQDNIEKKKDSLLMKIGAVKEIKDSLAQAMSLQKSKMMGFDDDIVSLTDSYNRILTDGTYVPSTSIPRKDQITAKAYYSPSVVFESKIVKIGVNQFDHVVKDTKNKIIRTEKKIVPVYTDLETQANDAINGPASDSAGVIMSYNKFKQLNQNGVNPEYENRYNLYKLYMNEVGQPVKDIKDFEPLDYAKMELIPRKYIPAPNQTERFYKEGKAGTVSMSKQQSAMANQVVEDFFSGDNTKRTSVINKLKGGLGPAGFQINTKIVGTNQKDPATFNKVIPAIGFFKAADNIFPERKYTISFERNDDSESAIRTIINDYITQQGKAGSYKK